MQYIKIILNFFLVFILVYLTSPLLPFIIIFFFPGCIVYFTSKSYYRLITQQHKSYMHLLFDKQIIVISTVTLLYIISVYYYFLNFILFDINFRFDYLFFISVLIFPALIMIYSSFNPNFNYFLKKNKIEDKELFEDQNRNFQKFLASVFISIFMLYTIMLILWLIENVEFGWKD
jgi:hypothetical protein